MARKKDTLIKQVKQFVDQFYAKDADLVKQTHHYLNSADYDSLVTLMEKMEQDSRRSLGVMHFELLGYAYQLNGEHYVKLDFPVTENHYQKALKAYEEGMHYATGSGEGWRFRTLYDSAQRRLKTLRAKNKKNSF